MPNGNRQRGAQSGWTRRRIGPTGEPITDQTGPRPEPQPDQSEPSLDGKLDVSPMDRRGDA